MKLVNSKMLFLAVFVIMNLKGVNSESETILPQETHRNKEETGSNLDNLDYRSAALSMFGSQTSSSVPRSSAPVYGMGTGYHNQKVFISQEHEKGNYGRIGPGPAHYTQNGKWNAKQESTESTKTGKNGWETASRFYVDRRAPLYSAGSGQPGPGHYISRSLSENDLESELIIDEEIIPESIADRDM